MVERVVFITEPGLRSLVIRIFGNTDDAARAAAQAYSDAIDDKRDHLRMVTYRADSRSTLTVRIPLRVIEVKEFPEGGSIGKLFSEGE